MNQPKELNNSMFTGKLIKLTTSLPGDVKTIWGWHSDIEFYQNAMGGTPYAVAESFVETWEKDYNKSEGNAEFRIRLLNDETNRLVGRVELHDVNKNFGSALLTLHIGDPNDRHKGYGTEAMDLILNYAFNEMRLHRVGLVVYEHNGPARAAYEKYGWTLEGTRRENMFRNGHYYDTILMGILEHEFRKKISDHEFYEAHKQWFEANKKEVETYAIKSSPIRLKP
jgi:RimJ/RimL family protein N-acetyltransferase